MKLYIIEPRLGRTEINEVKLKPNMIKDNNLYIEVISNNMGVGVRALIDLDEIDKIRNKTKDSKNG